jgi:hypothetical protein
VRSHTITVKRARRMRQALSPPQLALWSQIKGCKLEGFAFRRQHPVTESETLRLCDARPDAWLREQGIDAQSTREQRQG